MDVYWLEQGEADVPPDVCWLSAGEQARLASMLFTKRRGEWLLGRWTAKCAVAAHRGEPSDPGALARIEIRATPSGAPEAVCAEWRSGVTISLSHRGGIAVCAVAPAGVLLGCDVEVVEPRSYAFVADYFTAEEQMAVASVPVEERPRFVNLIWSAKESALKALGEGLRLDTRSVVVNLTDAHRRAGNWRPLRVRYKSEVFHGWWRQADGVCRTLVAAPPPALPKLLGQAESDQAYSASLSLYSSSHAI